MGTVRTPRLANVVNAAIISSGITSADPMWIDGTGGTLVVSPNFAASLTTACSPTSMPSFTATMLRDSMSARRNVMGPSNSRS